jgi:hypothetical protein
MFTGANLVFFIMKKENPPARGRAFNISWRKITVFS